MKRTISVIIITLLALGFGYYLFKISTGGGKNDFDSAGTKSVDRVRDVQADDHILGNPDAKNTLVAFEDIQCPACRNYEPILKAFPEALADTKVVFRHFPLISIHKNAAAAAYASEAAAAQGRFWEWVDLAYQRQEQWSGEKDPTESFVEIAREAGVADLERFKNDVINKTYRERVQRDAQEALDLKVPGTPSLYFNGVKLELGSLEAIKQQVEKLYK